MRERLNKKGKCSRRHRRKQLLAPHISLCSIDDHRTLLDVSRNLRLHLGAVSRGQCLMRHCWHCWLPLLVYILQARACCVRIAASDLRACIAFLRASSLPPPILLYFFFVLAIHLFEIYNHNHGFFFLLVVVVVVLFRQFFCFGFASRERGYCCRRWHWIWTSSFASKAWIRCAGKGAIG